MRKLTEDEENVGVDCVVGGLIDTRSLLRQTISRSLAAEEPSSIADENIGHGN